MSDFWMNFDHKQLYDDWTFGLIDGLTEHAGLFDTTPSQKTIEGILN